MQTQHVLHYVWRQHPVKYQAQGVVLRRSTLPRFLDVCPHSGDVHSGNHDRSRFYHSSVDKKSVRSAILARGSSCPRRQSLKPSAAALLAQTDSHDRRTRLQQLVHSSRDFVFYMGLRFLNFSNDEEKTLQPVQKYQKHTFRPKHEKFVPVM